MAASMCVLQMEYLAQILSAVGIAVDPETLQSIQDEPLETMSITPPRVGVQPAPVLSTCRWLMCLRFSHASRRLSHCIISGWRA